MKKLIILLFSVFVSINSYSGIFNETICFETDQKNIVFLPNETNAYTGKYSCKYGNGQKEIEGSYKDGRLFGKWTWCLCHLSFEHQQQTIWCLACSKHHH